MASRMFMAGLLAVVVAACGDPVGGTSTSGDAASGEDDGVKISFERSGGFAGITRTLEVTTDDLSAEDAAEVRRLIDEAGFFELPEEVAGDGSVADEFTYVITIEAGERSASVRTGDAGAPAALVPLLDWLNRAIRTRGG